MPEIDKENLILELAALFCEIEDDGHNLDECIKEARERMKEIDFEDDEDE